MDVRRKSGLLRDECERLAREAERVALDWTRPAADRHEAEELARVYWQMSRVHADTAAQAADARPVKFSGRNSGPQEKTAMRTEFLRKVAAETGISRRQLLAREAWGRPESQEHFGSYEALYTFLGRCDF